MPVFRWARRTGNQRASLRETAEEEYGMDPGHGGNVVCSPTWLHEGSICAQQLHQPNQGMVGEADLVTEPEACNIPRFGDSQEQASELAA